MKITSRKNGSVVILYLSGRITIGNGDVLLRDKFGALLDGGERFFIFNLTDVSYVDSAGVGEMVACYKRAAERGGVIKLVMLSRGPAREVFVITCLDRVFEIFTDEDAALASFPG